MITVFHAVLPRRRSTISILGSLAFCAACALAGCAKSPAIPDASISVAPEPGRAVIVGWGNTPAENARAALQAEQGTRVTRLFVAFVDGKKISFAENTARVPPGDHDLIISCGIYVGYRFFTQDSALRASFDANRVYRLRANPAGRRCEPYLEDVTGKNG